jgi:hypothetical protein
MDTFAQHLPPVDATLEAALAALEQDMPRLQAQAADVFVLASAWAERHDAIIAAAPAHLRADVEARLRRIGIRWGMMPGARMTTQFPALPPLAGGGKTKA